MNQTAAHVDHEKSEYPQNEENYRDRPKHEGILVKSELLARQSNSSPSRSRLRPRVCQVARSNMATSMPRNSRNDVLTANWRQTARSDLQRRSARGHHRSFQT